MEQCVQRLTRVIVCTLVCRLLIGVESVALVVAERKEPRDS